MIFFTISNNTYAAQALVLIKSIRRFYKKNKIYFVNTSTVIDPLINVYKKKYNFEILTLKEINIIFGLEIIKYKWSVPSKNNIFTKK